MSLEPEFTERFVKCVKKPFPQRTEEDTHYICYTLKRLSEFEYYNPTQLMVATERVFYELCEQDTILYEAGAQADCWYCVLSGSVILSMNYFFPTGASFGHCINSVVRQDECRVLEKTELLRINYTEEEIRKFAQQRIEPNSKEKAVDMTATGETLHNLSGNVIEDRLHDPQKNTSNSSLNQEATVQSRAESFESLDYLDENDVDSDDESVHSESSSATKLSMDPVLEVLSKPPEDRSEEDIKRVMGVLQYLPVFSRMTASIRQALFQTLIVQTFMNEGAIVIDNGEEVDKWYVVLDGQLRLVQDTETDSTYLHMGDSFGLSQSLKVFPHRGKLITTVKSCTLCYVSLEEYSRVLAQGDDMKKVIEDGRVVTVLEKRAVDFKREGYFIVQATPSELLKNLCKETVDDMYFKDFLLTYKTFLPSAVPVVEQLKNTWMEGLPEQREKVTVVVLYWVSEHFSDFEGVPEMMDFLDWFDVHLVEDGKSREKKFLDKLRSSQAAVRCIELDRPGISAPLEFDVVGGWEVGHPVFVSSVDQDSIPQTAGLRVGDQILEINGLKSTKKELTEVISILRENFKLSLLVKSNIPEFRSFMADPPRPQSDYRSRPVHPPLMRHNKGSASDKTPNSPEPKIKRPSRIFKPLTSLKLPSLRNRVKPDSRVNTDTNKSSDSGDSVPAEPLEAKGEKNTSFENIVDWEDIQSLIGSQDGEVAKKVAVTVTVVKLYLPNQSFKFIEISPSTRISELIERGVKEFYPSKFVVSPSDEFCIIMVTVNSRGGPIHNRVLPNHISDLVNFIGLESRYYLKERGFHGTLVQDEEAERILKEGRQWEALLELSPEQMAEELTRVNSEMFCNINSREYIADLWKDPDQQATKNLTKFGRIYNEVTYWVVTTVVSETRSELKAKLLKQFIKIAKFCKEQKNYNSMFSILSGLHHGLVSRQKSTWEKLPKKHKKVVEDLTDYMNPSRGMAKYRELQRNTGPPLVPWVPLFLRDLTFLFLGNETKVDGLVNFEKLRMLGKHIRWIRTLCQQPIIPKSPQDDHGKNALKRIYDHQCMQKMVRKHFDRKYVIQDEDLLKRILDSSEKVVHLRRNPPSAPVSGKKRSPNTHALRRTPSFPFVEPSASALIDDGSSPPPSPRRQPVLPSTSGASFDVESQPTKPLEIEEHPKDIVCKPGESAELFVKANTTDCIFQWQYETEPIPESDSDYKGSNMDHLLLPNCLSKHEGAYTCVLTDQYGRSITSNEAKVTTNGELIGHAGCKLLGGILQRMGSEVDFTVYGIETQDVLDGRSLLTYEETQFILRRNPLTQILSEILKDEIMSRLEEERLYQEAIANGHKISLSYTKILALGPGQVGKSTFLYRLMGLMKGNILKADPKTQPQSSTGIAELHEACIKYTSMTGALSSNKNWHVFNESSEIQSQLDGLIALLTKQTRDELKRIESMAESTNVATTAEIKPVNVQAEEDTNITTVSSNTKDNSICGQEAASQISEQNADKLDLESELQFIGTESEQPSETAAPNIIVPQKQNISRVIQEFGKLQRESKHSLTQEKIAFHMLFNVADIGGQPAFLEMLPSLTIGPALYLVFTKLLEGLNTRYPAAFKCKDDRGTKLCQDYTYTSEEVIFTALSSIACFGNSDEEVELYVANKDDKKQTTSLALLIGTHADKIDNSETLTAIDNELKQHIEETEFFTQGLIHSQKFLRVNNYSAAEEEIQGHRQLLENVLTAKFRQYDIPARWLMLSICLKLLAKNEGTHEVSFQDCVEIGKHFRMSEEMVKVALQFLHKYIGLVMYFPNHENLKNVVICDPQVVFTSISELIFKIYDPTNLQITEAQHDHFVQTGCFSPQDVKTTGHTQSKVLSIHTLIDLLVHLNIAAEVPITETEQDDTEKGTDDLEKPFQDEDSTTAQEPVHTPQQSASPAKRREYFFPAVLRTAEVALLKLKRARQAHEEQLPEPICIRFKTGYMPLGFVCALSAKLLAERRFQLIFREGSDFLTYKNMLKFRYEGKFDVLLISGPKYCEIRVTRHSGKADFWSKDCCPQIKQTICDAADSVIRSMKHGSLYKLSKGYELAFKCPKHPDAEIGHEPLAKMVYESRTQTQNLPKEIHCVKTTCGTALPLTPEMKMWFGEALPDIPLNVKPKPSLKGNKLKVTAQGSNPLRFQWFKDDEPLTDGDCYRGSSTSELIIEGTDSELKGIYQCCVTDRKENTKFTEEIEFDPFVLVLKDKGLRDNEIKTLIEYGYQGMEDLERLKVDDASLEKIGLKGLEIERVRDFLIKEFINPKSEKKPSTLEFCQTLIHALHDVRAHWYLLGIQLEIDHPTLEVIRRTCRGKTEYCFRELITRFLACKHPQSKVEIVEALKSPCIRRGHLVKEVEGLAFDCADTPKPKDAERSHASRLRRVLNIVWEVHADWHNLAVELIPSTAIHQAIERDYDNVGDRFAALLNQHLEGNQDPELEELLAALRSPAVGRNDIAKHLEKALQEEAALALGQ